MNKDDAREAAIQAAYDESLGGNPNNILRDIPIQFKYAYDAGFRDGVASVDRKAIVVEVIRSAPKHEFWGAGEPDCPREIKTPNGELHTLRCKNCDNPRFPVCLGFWEVNNAR